MMIANWILSSVRHAPPVHCLIFYNKLKFNRNNKNRYDGGIIIGLGDYNRIVKICNNIRVFTSILILGS